MISWVNDDMDSVHKVLACVSQCFKIQKLVEHGSVQYKIIILLGREE